MTDRKCYLGDGLYSRGGAEVIAQLRWIMTYIVLEPQVLASLEQWIADLRREAAQK